MTVVRGCRGRVLVAVLAGLLAAAVTGFIERRYGARILDVRCGCSTAEAVDALEKLGDDGRGAYGWYQVADLVFIVSYGAALVGGVRGFRRPARFLWLPVIAVVFDLAEGVLVRVALSTFPDTPTDVLAVASVCGVLKFATFFFAVAVVVIGLTYRSMVGRKEGP